MKQNGHKGTPRKGSRKGKGNISRETKAEMVAALPELGTQTAVAEAFGVSRPVVTRALTDPAVLPLVRVKKEEIADKLGLLVDKLAQRFLDIADGATLDNKAAVLLGIAADKHRLYLGEPTVITENRNDAALREEALKLLAEYKAALDGDEAKALQMLAQDAPTLSRWLN